MPLLAENSAVILRIFCGARPRPRHRQTFGPCQTVAANPANDCSRTSGRFRVATLLKRQVLIRGKFWTRDRFDGGPSPFLHSSRLYQRGFPRFIVRGLVTAPPIAPIAPPIKAPPAGPVPVAAPMIAPVPAPIAPPESARLPGVYPQPASASAKPARANGMAIFCRVIQSPHRLKTGSIRPTRIVSYEHVFYAMLLLASGYQ